MVHCKNIFSGLIPRILSVINVLRTQLHPLWKQSENIHYFFVEVSLQWKLPISRFYLTRTSVYRARLLSPIFSTTRLCTGKIVPIFCWSDYKTHKCLVSLESSWKDESTDTKIVAIGPFLAELWLKIRFSPNFRCSYYRAKWRTS